MTFIRAIHGKEEIVVGEGKLEKKKHKIGLPFFFYLLTELFSFVP